MLSLPELKGPFALDLETKDGGLQHDRGPGWAYPGHPQWDGFIAGFAIANEQYPSGLYIPIRHQGGDNYDEQQTLRWMRAAVKQAPYIVVGNAQYETGWCSRDDIDLTQTRIHDVLIQAPLIWEHDYNYSLDEVAYKYLGIRKNEADLRAAITKELGITKFTKSGAEDKVNIWRLSGKGASPYGTTDGVLTWGLFKKLQDMIVEQELEQVYDLECGMIPLLVSMRRQGVRVDLNKAEKLEKEFQEIEDNIIAELKWRTGFTLVPSDPKSAGPILREAGIIPPKTAKTGKDSITKGWLDSLGAEAGQLPGLINKCRKYWKARTTFIRDFIYDFEYLGRVHSELNSVKGEAGGTIGGRFSSKNPNLQQIPSRDKDIGPKVRSMYLPEEGEQWAAVDFSSQEPRLTVHFAALANVRGGREAKQKYIDNPRIDYHQMVADMCGISRKEAKTINLGLAYGMGGVKLCKSLGLPTAWKRKPNGQLIEVAGPEGQALIDKYHENAPFVRGLMRKAEDRAKKMGYVRTILGRRCRFPKIEGEFGQFDWVHKAMNRIIQGSAADFTKKAMLDLWQVGVQPLVSVHDELGFSVKSKEEAEKYAKIMCDAIELEIPMISDIEIGINWGSSMLGMDI